MGDKKCDSLRPPAQLLVLSRKFRTTTVNSMGNYDWRQGLSISKCPQLQEGRQGEIKLEDKNLRFPRNPGTTIRFPSYETRRGYDGRQGLISGTPDTTIRFPRGDYNWKSELAVSRHSVHKLQ